LKQLILLHSKRALNEVEHLKDGVEGLDQDLINLMTGAIAINEI
jgi:hypothetical protein